MACKPCTTSTTNTCTTTSNMNNNSIMGVQPPSLISRNTSLHTVALPRFGTNSGTLHTELLPKINANKVNYTVYNNMQRRLMTANHSNLNNTNNINNTHHNNMKTDQKHDINTAPLRADVQLLKTRIQQIVEKKYNLRDNQQTEYRALNEELYKIYTQQYLKHHEEKETSAAKHQLKQENPSMNIDESSIPEDDVLIKTNKSLAEVTILGQTLYLLASYKLEHAQIELAHKYIIRSLMYWRCANQCAKRTGATVKTYSNESLLNDIFKINANTNTNNRMNKVFPSKTNLDIDDLGFFWPQLVQSYIMAGNVFLKHFEYDSSELMYRTALELCHSMQGRYHFSCIDPLECLVTQMIIIHDIQSAVVYCNEIINIMTSNADTNKLVHNEYKLINTKALYSCLLRLSAYKKDQERGYHLKQQCIQECMDTFGVTSDHMFSLYLYFIKHCIQHGAEYMDVPTNFLEADEMIRYLSNTFSAQRKLKYYEEYHLCQVFREYVFVISEQAITKYGINARKKDTYRVPHQEQRKHHHIQRLEDLYRLHMKHIERLNCNPLSKQYNRNMSICKSKITTIYANAFEAYQEVLRANQLRILIK